MPSTETGAPPSARLRRGIGRNSADEVLPSGDEVKGRAEGRPEEGRRSLLGGVPRALPALVEAQQIASRAAGVGFDWENVEQVLDKLHEELAEFDAGAAATPRRTSWKTNSATCSSCWSTSRASSKWIPNRRCAEPTPNSAAASATSKSAWPSRAETGRRHHRRNGGAVAGSEAQVVVIEIRPLAGLDEFADVVRAAEDRSGATTTSNCVPCVSWWWWPKSAARSSAPSTAPA